MCIVRGHVKQLHKEIITQINFHTLWSFSLMSYRMLLQFYDIFKLLKYALKAMSNYIWSIYWRYPNICQVQYDREAG